MYVVKAFVSRSAVPFLFFFSKLSLHNFFKFIYSEREKEIERASINGERADREGERLPSSLLDACPEPDAGIEPMNHEIMT